MLQLNPTLFPGIGPPGQARTPPSGEFSHRPPLRPGTRSRRALPAPSGSPSPAGRSLGTAIPGGGKPPAGPKGVISALFPGAARPGRGVGGRGGTRAPVRRRAPRRALTQHEGAEAPGHALGQVVHIELHGVQGQRLLHGGAGTAAGRHPEPRLTPAARPSAGKRRGRGKGGPGGGPAVLPGAAAPTVR